MSSTAGRQVRPEKFCAAVAVLLAVSACAPTGVDRSLGRSGAGTGGAAAAGRGGAGADSGGDVAAGGGPGDGGAPGTGGTPGRSGGAIGTGGTGGTGGTTTGGPGMATGGAGPGAGAGGSKASDAAPVDTRGSGGQDASDGGPAAGGSTGAGGTPAAGYKFGAHPQVYPPGSIRPGGGQTALDAAVALAYDRWKAAYVGAGCGGFIVKTSHGEPGEMSGSAAIARGMIFAAMMAGHDPDAQNLFNGFYTVLRMKPSRYKGNEALAAYTIRAGCMTTVDDGSTFEGDADFAFALLLADKQWGSAGAIKYLDEAKKTIAAIKKFEMNPKLFLPLSGDWASLPGEEAKGWFTDTKVANFTLGHFRAFAQAAADPFWMDTVAALHKLTDTLQTMYSPAGFLPEYLDESKPAKTGYAIATDKVHAGEFGGNAALALFRLAADHVVSKDPASRAELGKISDSIKKLTGGDASKIVDGYLLAGTAFGAKGTAAFFAPLGAAAIFAAADQAWLDGIWKRMTDAAAAGVDSETDSANLLGMLVVSGNWWAP